MSLNKGMKNSGEILWKQIPFCNLSCHVLLEPTQKHFFPGPPLCVIFASSSRSHLDLERTGFLSMSWGSQRAIPLCQQNSRASSQSQPIYIHLKCSFHRWPRRHSLAFDSSRNCCIGLRVTLFELAEIVKKKSMDKRQKLQKFQKFQKFSCSSFSFSWCQNPLKNSSGRENLIFSYFLTFIKSQLCRTIIF